MKNLLSILVLVSVGLFFWNRVMITSVVTRPDTGKLGVTSQSPQHDKSDGKIHTSIHKKHLEPTEGIPALPKVAKYSNYSEYSRNIDSTTSSEEEIKKIRQALWRESCTPFLEYASDHSPISKYCESLMDSVSMANLPEHFSEGSAFIAKLEKDLDKVLSNLSLDGKTVPSFNEEDIETFKSSFLLLVEVFFHTENFMEKLQSLSNILHIRKLFSEADDWHPLWKGLVDAQLVRESFPDRWPLLFMFYDYCMKYPTCKAGDLQLISRILPTMPPTSMDLSMNGLSALELYVMSPVEFQSMQAFWQELQSKIDNPLP